MPLATFIALVYATRLCNNITDMMAHVAAIVDFTLPTPLNNNTLDTPEEQQSMGTRILQYNMVLYKLCTGNGSGIDTATPVVFFMPAHTKLPYAHYGGKENAHAGSNIYQLKFVASDSPRCRDTRINLWGLFGYRPYDNNT